MFLQVWPLDSEMPVEINDQFIIMLDRAEKKIFLSETLPYYGKRVLSYSAIKISEKEKCLALQ